MQNTLTKALRVRNTFADEAQRLRDTFAEAQDMQNTLTKALRLRNTFAEAQNVQKRLAATQDLRRRFAQAQSLQSALSNINKRFSPPEIAEATKGSLSPLIYSYSLETEAQKNEQESAFERNKAAYDLLQRFETWLRWFIDKKMKVIFGPTWTKHQVPGKIRRQWLEKKQKARENGEPERPLIAYADFTDYVQIITRKDNWEKVFKPIFRRNISVQESFQRLYPIRICTMHARAITRDEELYLYVEVKRIMNTIRNRDLSPDEKV